MQLAGRKPFIVTERQVLPITQPYSPRPRGTIAIVGSGISGLSAAWLLNQRHEITVFEQSDYVGGHSNTVDIETECGVIPVDTGFIVYNPVNYPNLVALFEHLGVPTTKSDMSFAASLDDGALEYSGTDLNGLFSQRGNLVRPRFLRMLSDLLRFYRQAKALMDAGNRAQDELESLSLEDFLRRERYSDAFIYDHLMPMGAAIWSTSIEEMLSFPTLSFLRFFRNHGLVQLTDRPEWRSVAGGSREYVRRMTAGFRQRIRCEDPVVRVIRDRPRPQIVTAAGHTQEFDAVVMACHADEALGLLADADGEERETLGGIKYQPNRAILHTDVNLMPRRRRAWASWNYIGSRSGDSGQALCVTYWMNLLQELPTRTPVFVTLNPCRQIDPARILGTFDYTHPLFDARAMRAQKRLWGLQGKLNTWYCGAYFGSGFHEDGIQAGLAVAEQLGGLGRPWELENASDRIILGPPDRRARRLDPLAA